MIQINNITSTLGAFFTHPWNWSTRKGFSDCTKALNVTNWQTMWPPIITSCIEPKQKPEKVLKKLITQQWFWRRPADALSPNSDNQLIRPDVRRECFFTNRDIYDFFSFCNLFLHFIIGHHLFDFYASSSSSFFLLLLIFFQSGFVLLQYTNCLIAFQLGWSLPSIARTQQQT